MEGFVHNGHQPQSNIIDCEFLVTGAQSTILFVPAYDLLDDVSLPRGGLVELLVPWLVGSRGNDGPDPSSPTPPPDARIAVPLIGCESPWPTALAAAAVKQPTSHRGLERLALMPLSGGQMEGEEETVAVADQMDLRAKPAPGTSQPMVRRLLHLRRLWPSQSRPAARVFFSPQPPPGWPG
jgi:hypothetical protein